MKLGIRTRQFGISFALVIIAGLISGIWLEVELRSWLEQRVETELTQHLQASSVTIVLSQDPNRIETLDDLADQLGAAMDIRVTVIGPDGDVLGDSKVEPHQLSSMDNHAGRPEVIATQGFENIEERARDKQMNLNLLIAPGLTAQANQSALEQVIMNLIDNALKYTPARGSIVVQCTESQGHTRIEVNDNGPGIPIEHRQRIFERFYRADTGRSRALGGTGLGLSIVRNLILAMGGQVGMEPQVPHGACFWIELPIDTNGHCYEDVAEAS